MRPDVRFPARWWGDERGAESGHPISRRDPSVTISAPSAPSPHFTLEAVEDGVYVAIATDQGHALCNSGIVDLGDGTLVFDSMLTPQAGADLRRVAEHLTGHPVTYLVNSHCHGDHIRGNSSFPSVRIVSTRRVRELIDERAVKALETDRATVAADLEKLRQPDSGLTDRDRAVFGGWFEGILATPEGCLIPGPDLFVDGRLVLAGPKRQVEVLSFGGGHSPSDVLAYLPDSQVGFLGDLLSIGFHPGVGDGVPAEWLRILDEVLKLGIDRALPGHGPVGGREDIEFLQGYLQDLIRLAHHARRLSIRRDQLVSVPMPEKYAAWVFRPFFAENLARVYDLTAMPA